MTIQLAILLRTGLVLNSHLPILHRNSMFGEKLARTNTGAQQLTLWPSLGWLSHLISTERSISDLHCHRHCPRHRRQVMLWRDLHLESYQHEPAVCPRRIEGEIGEEKSNFCFMFYGFHVPTADVISGIRYLFVLLEQVVQIVTPLVIEIKVLALRLTFSAHHFGNGRPVPAVLHQPYCRAEK